MPDSTLFFIALVFVLAGAVKGLIGLGLPTISMGLLALVMPPIQAAAILLLPSFVTNLWQMVAGPGLSAIARRLWPMMLAICIGTWAGIGLMTGAAASWGTTLLGIALIFYALTGLTSRKLTVSPASEWLLAPVVGALTGFITAATGVFVLPAVPYLQAIGMDKDELVQALGLSFTVSTAALSLNVVLEGGLTFATAPDAVLALIFASIGMAIGQMVRRRLSAGAFRWCFFFGLLALGFYLSVRSHF
jgi:uncharacterized membrane protein YfcA